MSCFPCFVSRYLLVLQVHQCCPKYCGDLVHLNPITAAAASDGGRGGFSQCDDVIPLSRSSQCGGQWQRMQLAVLGERVRLLGPRCGRQGGCQCRLVFFSLGCWVVRSSVVFGAYGEADDQILTLLLSPEEW